MPRTRLIHIRRIAAVVSLELLAVVLAFYQSLGSVRTDEAKYLLNIPYPHPPLARAIFHAFERMPQQELFLRIVLATFLVQAVWVVILLGKRCSGGMRLALAGFWIFSAAVLFQAGTVMMAPLTALQGLVFVWLLMSNQSNRNSQGGWIALFWLASLFTAYQAVLYLPIVIAIFLRMKLHPILRTLAVCVPIFLMVLYMASNPLAAASFVNAGNQNVDLSVSRILQQILYAWLWSGSAVLSVAGLFGMVRSRNVALLLSFFLVVAFLAMSFREYYAVLFLPLLVGGVIAAPSALPKPAALLAFQIAAAAFIFAHTGLEFVESPARAVMRVVNALPREGIVLIAGGFGHEWQYESVFPVHRYRSALLSKAVAAVCLEPCPETARYGFIRVPDTDTEVWVRAQTP